MAYQESVSKKIIKLITDPKKYYTKVIPFLKSKLSPHIRSIREFFGDYSLSKPYIGHDDLLKLLGNIKNGFFVQCGGNDGYGFDPTYYLEKALGWGGIIVEPLPIYMLCKNNRQNSVIYNCAVGSFDNPNKTTSFIDCNLMSFVKGSIDNEKEWIDAGERTQSMEAQIVTVPIKPVQELIDECFTKNTPRKIHLFVADTEGYEFEVIQGLDFTKNSPTHILLEIHKDDRLNAIKNYLSSKGYDLMGEIGYHDYIFKLK